MACPTCRVATYSSRIILRTRLTMLPTDACSGSAFVSFLPSPLTSATRSLQYQNQITHTQHQTTTTTTLLMGHSSRFNHLLSSLPVSMDNDLLQ